MQIKNIEYLNYTESQNILTVNHPDLPEFRLVKVAGGEGIIAELDKKTKVATFYMAEHQVTQELYQAVRGKNPSEFKGRRRPIENVNWYDSVKFCQKLNDILQLPQPIKGNDNKAELDIKKQGFRLPTEAEWEYAAGGGHKNLSVSARPDSVLANNYPYAGTKHLHHAGWYDANNNFETRPVGLKFPNQLGLYDMSGNVWEWCWDWYDKDKDARVLRGASWNLSAYGSRVAYRLNRTPDFIWSNGGFRLVLSSSS